MDTTNVYAPESSLGWLDFDSAASDRVGELLRAFDEPSTADVLGLGVVRDAFAEMLHPGTSTVQTRLRYFLFVPWICARLERERVPPADFPRRMRDEEARLIDCLRDLGRNAGVIGYNARRRLKRMPSDVYWGGLGRWGLRRLDLSIGEYGRCAASLGGTRTERDDDHNAMARTVSMWASLPDPPAGFPDDEVSFELTSTEAQMLVELIRQNCNGTLLAELCTRPGAAAGVRFPWDLPTGGLSTELVDILRHARNFSELTAGPQHLYNLLLARRARSELDWDTDELDAVEAARLQDWSSQIAGRLDEVHAWAGDLPAFWDLLRECRVGLSTRSFVEGIVAKAANDPEGFADDPGVHSLIRDRELRLKGQRARLTHRAALENWNGSAVGGQFDYRWGTAKSFLADIATAQGEGG